MVAAGSGQIRFRLLNSVVACNPRGGIQLDVGHKVAIYNLDFSPVVDMNNHGLTFNRQRLIYLLHFDVLPSTLVFGDTKGFKFFFGIGHLK